MDLIFLPSQFDFVSSSLTYLTFFIADVTKLQFFYSYLNKIFVQMSRRLILMLTGPYLAFSDSDVS
jgi:hypothetical protein